jgi:acyl-coenzyme A thioesterase PaaI-like protein
LTGIGEVAPRELVELAGSVRTLVDRMLRIRGAQGELARAREEIDAVARHLEPLARPEGPPRLGRGSWAEGARPYYVEGVMLPRHHPQAADFEIATADGVTRGTVRFGVVFEGPPGCVHGGHVACFFDQILGHHNLELGLPAMTVNLSVRYRKPTPLFTRLDFEVRIQSSEGRKVVTVGTLREGERVFAEAEGLFVLPDVRRTGLLPGSST